MKTKKVDRNKFNVGDYVFVSKYSDADPNDPWAVDFINEVCTDMRGDYIRIYKYGVRAWRNVKKISKKQGDKIIEMMHLTCTTK